jgi:predicted ATPase/class 3 adenylate cyclase
MQTYTFLFTEIAGSEKLWEEYPATMGRLLGQYDRLLRGAVYDVSGLLFKRVGAEFYAVFPDPVSALEAAAATGRGLASAAWDDRDDMPPPQVTMALHTGPADARDGDYFGPALNRTARLLAASPAGGILLTGATAEAVGARLPHNLRLRDLGEHRFRDLKEPERVYQLVGPGLPADLPPLRALPASVAHNLPIQLTPFIGRRESLAKVVAALGTHRLVTLTGSGGTGKTRLALQAAAEVLDGFPDGVWVAELASIGDPDLVGQAVATALGVRGQPGQPIEVTLVSYVGSQAVLILLDNCEHLLEASARLTAHLLAGCPHVTILASSREALGLPGEWVYRVPSLDLPAGQTDPKILAEIESVSLFVDRAQAVQPAFALTAGNAPAVAAICRRLDGIPLALELAAARVRIMPVEGIAKRLDDRFRLLTGGSRTAMPRQQTLRALIDWSYDLLPPAERTTLRALSVFAGGFTLPAAQAVVGDPPDAPLAEVLAQLSNKSLLLEETQPDGGRYRLLETIRQYAADLLVESGESAAIRSRHRDYFLALAEEAEAPIRSHYDTAWMDRIETEHDNMRLALEWSQADPDGSELELRLAGALQPFWRLRGYWTEGRAWLDAALARTDSRFPAARAKALEGAGRLATGQGDFANARSMLEGGAALFRHVGDIFGTARTLVGLSWVAQRQGDLLRAESALNEALGFYRELDNRQGIADVLENLGIIALNQGNFEQAEIFSEESMLLHAEIDNGRGLASSALNLGEALRAQQNWNRAAKVIEQALVIYRQNSDKAGIALAQHNLGQIHLAQGDAGAAGRLLAASVGLYRQLDNREGIAMCLAGLVAVAAHQAQWGRAARLAGATDGLLRSLKAHLDPPDAAVYTEHVAEARAVLSGEEWTAAWTAGTTFSLDEAVAYGSKGD